MASDGLSTPSGMGGLMRYNEEYPSKLQIKPEIVVGMIIAAVVVITIIKIMF